MREREKDLLVDHVCSETVRACVCVSVAQCFVFISFFYYFSSFILLCSESCHLFLMKFMLFVVDIICNDLSCGS